MVELHIAASAPPATTSTASHARSTYVSVAASSVRQCRAMLSDALSAAKRWAGSRSTCSKQRASRACAAPNPPLSEEAQRSRTLCLSQDAEWGTSIWPNFITAAPGAVS